MGIGENRPQCRDIELCFWTESAPNILVKSPSHLRDRMKKSLPAVEEVPARRAEVAACHGENRPLRLSRRHTCMTARKSPPAVERIVSAALKSAHTEGQHLLPT
ncbi:unnamed protein product [Sphagnum tenellum]